MAETSLEEFVEAVNGTSHLRVEHDFGGGFVRLRTSEAERRQAAQDIRCVEDIVLELLRNSRDAHASKIFVGMSREGTKRTLVVIDDGQGIPASMHEHVFEPRVTSKLDTAHLDAWGMHGRGMALFSIAMNTDVAEVKSSGEGLGCSIAVQADSSKLAEKSDQSSFPTFTMSEEGTVKVRGPRNVLRTACEFAIESRTSCDVYVGSPVEVIATMFYYGSSTLSAIDKAFCRDVYQLPLVKRLATASEPSSLRDLAHEMGVDLSERTARRIMNGEIHSLEPILNNVKIVGNEPKSNDRKKRNRAGSASVKLETKDSETLKEAMKDSFSEIARKYYLEEDVDPSVRIMRNRVSISIPLVPKDG